MANTNPITHNTQAKLNEEIDFLNIGLSKIDALLMAITGASGVEVLFDMGDAAANNYLSVVSDLLVDCRVRAKSIAGSMREIELANPRGHLLADREQSAVSTSSSGEEVASM